jgi:hypothetical protein
LSLTVLPCLHVFPHAPWHTKIEQRMVSNPNINSQLDREFKFEIPTDLRVSRARRRADTLHSQHWPATHFFHKFIRSAAVVYCVRQLCWSVRKLSFSGAYWMCSLPQPRVHSRHWLNSRRFLTLGVVAVRYEFGVAVPCLGWNP